MSMFRRIGMANFGRAAAVGGTVSISNQTIISSRLSPSSISRYRLGASGIATYDLVNDPDTNLNALNQIILGEWLTSGSASSFSYRYVYGTVTNGTTTPPTGTSQNIWYALGDNDKTWSHTVSAGAGVLVSGYRDITISLALSSDTATVLDSAVIRLEATADNR